MQSNGNFEFIVKSKEKQIQLVFKRHVEVKTQMPGAYIRHWTRYVRIAEPLQNVVVQEGQRAKFVCKIDVHDLDLPRLKVTWRINGRYWSPDTSREGHLTGSGNIIQEDGFVDLDDSPDDIDDLEEMERSGNRRLVFKQDRGWHTLIVRKTRVTDSGVYSCIASVGRDTDMSSAHLKIHTAPDPPNNVKVASCHGNSAALSWEPGQEYGNKVIEFQVQFNTSAQPDVWHDFDERFGAQTRMVTLALYPGLTYSFRVKARNILGSSKPSAPTSRKCTTPPDRPHGNPRNVRTLTGVKGMLVIVWQPMSRLHFHGPRFRYHVRWRRHGSFKWNDQYVDDPAQGFLDVETNDVYQVYDLHVKAENSMGESNLPAYIYRGHSGESEPLVAPSNFSLNPDMVLEPHTAHFMWDPVDLDTKFICGKFRGYKLRYWVSKEGFAKKKEVKIAMSEASEEGGDNQSPVKVALSDLPAYTSLQAQVAVINTHYTGPFSKLLEFFTPEGVPSAVQDLRLQAYGVAYVLLKWRPPDQPNGIIQGYNIAYQQVFGMSLGPTKPLLPHINDPSTLGARITGLRPEHRYRFIVWARTRQGSGEPNFVDMTTAKGKPPKTPRIQVAGLGNSSVNVTWMADQASPDVKYLVEYRETGHSEWHNTEYVFDKSWLMLDKAQVPGSDMEVRLVASNRLGDTATSRTVAVAKTLKNTGGFPKAPIPDITLHNNSGEKLQHNKGRPSKSASWSSHAWSVIGALLVLALYSRVFQQ
ncbi:neural cell adhesion molecule l1 [Plakobranchus ocellatus]|uniref:Neural cell adhesion molecule l1 n=1 Tax=Plakobranchus ocellatus TaxID=259542 RepID=A0AAV4DI21_9GAST|nr:neural cell adhesion molecule l1 [Plakobranchus ocellatus]